MRDSIPRDMRSSYSQQCYPLYYLLQALGNPRVDLLSLDIEESPAVQIRIQDRN